MLLHNFILHKHISDDRFKYGDWIREFRKVGFKLVKGEGRWGGRENVIFATNIMLNDQDEDEEDDDAITGFL